MRDLNDEIGRYVDERKRLGYSRTHMQATARTLAGVAHFVGQRKRGCAATEPTVYAADVTEADLLAFLDRELLRGLSPVTVTNEVMILRGFFAHLARRGLLLLDPARRLATPKRSESLGYIPTHDHIRRILAACSGGDTRDLLRHALVELLYGSGLRISEVRNLDLGDVDLVERRAFIRLGKGRKDRVVPITKAAARAITRYLKARPASKHRALLIGIGGTKTTVATLSVHIRNLGRLAALGEPLTPHCLRHACAVHLLQNGADVRLIQKLLGHASIRTTTTYLRLDTASVTKAHARAHPRELRAWTDDDDETREPDGEDDD